MNERDLDLEDVALIARSGMNYGRVLEECMNQSKRSKIWWNYSGIISIWTKSRGFKFLILGYLSKTNLRSFGLQYLPLTCQFPFLETIFLINSATSFTTMSTSGILPIMTGFSSLLQEDCLFSIAPMNSEW